MAKINNNNNNNASKLKIIFKRIKQINFIKIKIRINRINHKR